MYLSIFFHDLALLTIPLSSFFNIFDNSVLTQWHHVYLYTAALRAKKVGAGVIISDTQLHISDR